MLEMVQELLNRPDANGGQPFPLVKGPDHLRMMTYNIRIDHVDDRDGHHCWSVRKKLVAGLIGGYAPDIVALQEVDGRQADDLHTLLPDYRIDGFPAGFGQIGEERLLFLYRSERLELLEKAVFSLSPTPDRPAKAWDARYPRAFVYGKFCERGSRRVIAFFNTHFDHVGQEARAEGAKVLLRMQKALSASIPHVVLGDFNFFPEAGGEAVYAAFIDPTTGLRDIRDVAAKGVYGPDGTWIGWGSESSSAAEGIVGCRLDHIFIGGDLQVWHTGVSAASIDAEGRLVPDYLTVKDPLRRFPSDHLPVIADVIL